MSRRPTSVVLTDFGADCTANYSKLQEYIPGAVVGGLLCFLLLLSALAYKFLTLMALLLISLAIMVVSVISSPCFVTLFTWCSLSGDVKQYEEL